MEKTTAIVLIVISICCCVFASICTTAYQNKVIEGFKAGYSHKYLGSGFMK